MPSATARVLFIDRPAGKIIAKIEINGYVPRVGDLLTLHHGQARTLPQNRLYFKFLRWCIEEAGLRDQGHFDVDALHLDLKRHFLADKVFTRGEFKAIEECSTTDLDRKEFSEYFEKVEHFIQDFFGISTVPFWETHGGKNFSSD